MGGVWTTGGVCGSVAGFWGGVCEPEVETLCREGSAFVEVVREGVGVGEGVGEGVAIGLEDPEAPL